MMSQRICQFMFIIPGGCERWMSFLHWKVQLSVIFRGSFYYSLCCMMKNWSWNQKKNIYTEWFSCNSVENWWNLRIGYVYIVNKKEWQQWWMIIVCSVINLGLQYQRNVDQSVTGCINLALVADEQVRNW